MQINTFRTQQLPSGFPQTTLFGYGGNVLTDPSGNPSLDGTGQIAFKRTSPGPKFEQTKGVPALIHYRNQLTGSHPLAVDPTLDWANPNNFPKPLPPFAPFPPGYPQAQSPIAHTTHTHGIEVVPQFDGTPDTWFTAGGIHGPEFVSNDYTQPSSNQSAAFWYHDHAFGVTRLDVGMGLSGYSILRDPNNALDRLGNSDILGMEDVYQWKLRSGVAPGNSTTHSQGSFSVSLTNPGTTELRSDPFVLTATLPSSITIDVFIPTGGATGNAFMFVDCPSKGLTRFSIGNVSLSGRTQNAFNTLTFDQVPSSQIGNSCVDFRLTVRLQGVGSGTYLLDNIRGPANVPATPLPSREFEVPTIVQSRSFRTDGEVYYPLASQAPPGETVGANPDVNPYWLLMFDGETNVVNGTVWPNMNVQRHAYRFRFLNSSNQRFYRMQLSNGMPFTIIGEDGGYIRSAQNVTAFNIGVTERVDTIIDFSNIPVGTKIVLQNVEQRQPPIGAPADPNTDGTVMQFTVVAGPTVPPRALPATLNTIATLTPDRPTRFLIQNVQSDDAGRLLQAELDGQLFHTQTTELPTIGSTEDWAFINTTPLTHNKHVHLIEFQVVKRQAFDAAGYLAAWKQANGNPPFSHPTLQPGSGPVPHRPGAGGRARGERLEGHRAHAGRRGHLDPDPLGAAAGRGGHQHAGREPVPVRSDVRHRVRLALPPGGARGQRDDAADDRHPDVGRGRQLSGRLPRLAGRRSGVWSTSTGSTTPRASPTPRSRARRRTRARICGSASTTRTAIGPFRSSTTWETGSSSGATSTRRCRRTRRRTPTARTSRRRCGSWCSSRSDRMS